MLLEVEGLEVFYGRIQALRGISFSVTEGEIVPLLEKRAKRRHAGARADHDQRRGGIGRHGEVFLLVLQIHLRAGSNRPTFVDPRRRHARPSSTSELVRHRDDQHMDLIWVSRETRRDRIQARQDGPERSHEFGGSDVGRRVRDEDVEDIVGLAT